MYSIQNINYLESNEHEYISNEFIDIINDTKMYFAISYKNLLKLASI